MALPGGIAGSSLGFDEGARADLVILDGDLDPDHPPAVAETWLAGHRRHPPGLTSTDHVMFPP